ncbi:MAG: cell division protein FtsQ [Alphaproteobacteria bacterium]|nr:cell division protein FtsQ [Alphaproteobacteria bacterium]
MTVEIDPLAPPGSPAGGSSTGAMPLRIRPSMLPGVALLAILLIGLGSSLYTLGFRRGDIPAQDTSVAAVADGKAAAAVSRLLQHANPLEDPLVTVDRVTAWLATGDLGARVRRGCGNWLYLTDELTLYPDRLANAAKRVALVERVGAYLKGRNIRLLVAPVPDKSRIEAANLCGVDRPAALKTRLGAFEEGLTGAGVAVVDLERPMRAAGGEAYYRTDTHWNEHGAKAAADAVAAVLKEDGTAPTQNATFRVTSEPRRERVGDLIRLAGLDHVPYPLRPRGDDEAASAIEQSASGNVGLLDETPAPELAVVGTSFSRRANFVPFLALALGAPAENRAEDDGGVTKAAIDYFAAPAFAKAPPRTIVWEIPERMIEEPVAASDIGWAAQIGAPNAPK